MKQLRWWFHNHHPKILIRRSSGVCREQFGNLFCDALEVGKNPPKPPQNLGVFCRKKRVF